MIYFYSTKNKSSKTSLKEAVLRGLAEDGGLFMPHVISGMPKSFFNTIETLSFKEIAFEVSRVLLQDAITPNDLAKIIGNAINFDAPLKEISEQVYALELFHGPTLSFKDFGARFMAQLMGHFVQQSYQTLNILVATSGDTGSAIAQAFLGVPGIKVWILYPKGKVSSCQEKQLTTIGENITALEVAGTFDDCQSLVKQAFSDPILRSQMHLTSANSINIARLIPQTFYYFNAYARLKKPKDPVVFSVPCGNFGNLTAGLIAKKMGLPVSKFIAATNINDSVPKYLQTGVFEPHASKHTLSNAMDVGNPSNFARMLDLYDHQLERMREDVYGVSFTDDQTCEAMLRVCEEEGYLLDPHGAVAYLGLQSYLKNNTQKTNGIFLETAHPAKFAEDVEKITNLRVPIPTSLQEVLTKTKSSIEMSTKYEELRSLLIFD